MARLIRELGLPEAVVESYEVQRHGPGREGRDEKRLVGLADLNIFIGPNHAGKSRLLRALLLDEKPQLIGGDTAWSEVLDRLLGLRQALSEGPITDEAKRYVFADLPYPVADGHASDAWNSFLQPWRAGRVTGSIYGGQTQESRQQVRSLIQQVGVSLSKVGNVRSPPKLHRVYLPTLRGLRPLAAQDVYARRTSNDYLKNKGITLGADGGSHFEHQPIDKRMLYTGQDFYTLVHNYLLGSLADRDRIGGFQDFLSRSFFGGQQVAIIPRVNRGDELRNILHVKVGEARERPIHDLGDGIAQVICLTLPMFLLADRDTLFFIEEPEMHLHQGLQRLLVQTILRGPGHEQRQTFLTTHSPQFLDLTLDEDGIAVYRCGSTLQQRGEEDLEADHRFTVELVSGDRRPILRELGVHRSSVLLANCTIWVEGVTDRLYLRHFFSLYQEQLGPTAPRFMEDLHFAFVEYGGSNLKHWSIASDEPTAINVDFLCSEGLLIIDHDNAKWKDQLHEQLKEKLGDRFYRLPVREVENLLTFDTILAVIRDYEGDAELEPLTGQPRRYRDRALGRAIEQMFFNKLRLSRRRSDHPYEEKSGTIKNKPDFCARALRHIESIDQMSEDAVSVCEKMHDFIRHRNRG